MMRLVIGLLALLPTAAIATPDRFARVKETLFAYNNTHAFILRKIEDNHGSYYTTQTDVVLIARPLATGVDDRQWPVISIFDRGAEFGSDDENVQVLNLGVSDRVNPFDVILWRGASNILPIPWPGASYLIDTQSDSLTISSPYDKPIKVDLRAANASLADSIAQTVQALDPQEKLPEGDAWPDYIRLDEVLDEPCRISNFYRLRTQGDPIMEWIAVNRSCGEDGMQVSDIIIAPVPQ